VQQDVRMQPEFSTVFWRICSYRVSSLLTVIPGVDSEYGARRAGYELRDGGCGLRVAGYGVRVERNGHGA